MEMGRLGLELRWKKQSLERVPPFFFSGWGGRGEEGEGRKGVDILGYVTYLLTPIAFLFFPIEEGRKRAAFFLLMFIDKGN